MADFKLNGYSYEVIKRPAKNGKKQDAEVIKWPTGFKNLWQRISYQDYLDIKSSSKK